MNALEKLIEWVSKANNGLSAPLIELDPICREFEDGWMELPKDADGVPIRVREVMDGNRGTVTCIRDAGHGWEIVTDHMYSYNPADLRHHKPTVEDMLSEMLERAFPSDFMHRAEAIEAMVTEYASKLRLAGDGEEQ